jgi:hypothetical protein
VRGTRLAGWFSTGGYFADIFNNVENNSRLPEKLQPRPPDFEGFSSVLGFQKLLDEAIDITSVPDPAATCDGGGIQDFRIVFEVVIG